MRRVFVEFASFSSLACALLVGAASASAEEPVNSPQANEEQIDFLRDIQPLLQRSCYSCHGGEAQEGGLRLDVKKRAFAGGDSGKAIAPGKSGESRLLKLIAGVDEDLGVMPPEGEGAPLTEDEVALVRRWIEQGAPWPDSADADNHGAEHWSFQPISRHTVPAVNDAAWLQTPIDAFILSRLEKQGIAPSPPAGRRALVRRLYLDLLGLLPTPDEIAAFVNDNSPVAYERLVERVLASPHYGERWGRHWLDLARYADSDGYEKDRPRPHAWQYRQWVIDALNADTPFDRFSIMQIAGDMLPDAGLEEKTASGFHRNTLHNTEGGIDPEEDRVKKTVDRTNTVGAIWLGLTIGCAQCHTHKYDPIAQREYYSLYAFFNSIDEVDVDAPRHSEKEQYAAAKRVFDAEHDKLQAAVKDYEANQLAAAQAKWEISASAAPAVWKNLEVTSAVSKHGAELKQQDDGSLLPTGKNELSDVYTIEATSDLESITTLRLEVLPDRTLAKNGPGRADNGNFVLTTVKVAAAPLEGAAEPVEMKLQHARADFAQNGWPPVAAINQNPNDGWAVSPQFGKRHVLVFEPREAIAFAGGARLTITLDQTYNQPAPHNLGRFRLSATSAGTPADLEGLPADIAAILHAAAAERSDEQQKRLANYYRDIDPELAKLKKAVEDHAKKAPSPGYSKAQTVVERSTPRQTHVHIRGDFLSPGDEVAIDVPDVLPAIEPRGAQPDRLDLAHWIFDPDNPLTARVTVNRVWQRIFGRGLVVTSDDFGKQGQPPSHPQLLDWLASELIDSGWSLKHVQRLIVRSAAYRQSSIERPELVDVDPENVLLARQNRQRVEAEVVRDVALTASGLLDRRTGGPSVRPAQPAEYSELTYAGSAKWETSKGGDRYRRGMYTFFQRTSPYPMLMTFDSPDSNECEAARSTSNTPLQALTLWNDPVFVDCAQALARRIVRSVPANNGDEDTTRARIDRAFQICLARHPDDIEMAALLELYQAQLNLLREDEEAAKALCGEYSHAISADPVELAAWVIVGRTLLNLDEFITKE